MLNTLLQHSYFKPSQIETSQSKVISQLEVEPVRRLLRCNILCCRLCSFPSCLHRFPFFHFLFFMHTLSCAHANKHINMHTFILPVVRLHRVPRRNGRLTLSGFNFCDPFSSLWSRHRAAEWGLWKYLRSAAWGGGSKGKKLAFNKQDNGCHTPLLTPLLPAISFSLSPFLSLSMPHPLHLTFSFFFCKNCIPCLRMRWKTERVWEKESKFGGGKGGPDRRTNN